MPDHELLEVDDYEFEDLFVDGKCKNKSELARRIHNANPELNHQAVADIMKGEHGIEFNAGNVWQAVRARQKRPSYVKPIERVKLAAELCKTLGVDLNEAGQIVVEVQKFTQACGGFPKAKEAMLLLQEIRSS